MARRTIVRSARQHKRWVQMGTNTRNAIAADGTFLVSQDVSRDEPFTVLRMIGEYSVGPSGVNVINDAVAIGFGIGVVSSDAFVVGGTAVPDPIGDVGYPWLFWSNHMFEQTIARQESEGDPLMALRRTFDIRTMRKVSPGQSVAQIFQYVNISGNPTIRINWGITRVLIGV